MSTCFENEKIKHHKHSQTIIQFNSLPHDTEVNMQFFIRGQLGRMHFWWEPWTSMGKWPETWTDGWMGGWVGEWIDTYEWMKGYVSLIALYFCHSDR